MRQKGTENNGVCRVKIIMYACVCVKIHISCMPLNKTGVTVERSRSQCQEINRGASRGSRSVEDES